MDEREQGEREQLRYGGSGEYAKNQATDECAKAMREPTARELLQWRIAELMSEVRGLDALLRALPNELPREAEGALARLIRKGGQ